MIKKTTKRDGLVQADISIISSQYSLYTPKYNWQLAQFVLNINHLLTHEGQKV
jgi:hypothetical protein